MKKHYSLRALCAILSILMIFSVFSVIQVYAAYKVDSVSLSYDIDRAYLNTALKEKDVSEALVGTSRTNETSSPLYNYIKDQSYLCYLDSSGTFKRLDNSEDFCKSERQYYYSAKFKTTSSGTWEPEILEMKEGEIKKGSSSDFKYEFYAHVNSVKIESDDIYVSYSANSETLSVYFAFDNWGEKNSGQTGDCKWTVENGDLKITGSGKTGDYSGGNAPWQDRTDRIRRIEIEADAGETITIANSTFSSLYKAERVTFSGVDKIGDNAFKGCTALPEMVIPSSITEIGEYAFADTNLSSLYLLPTLTHIGDKAFGYVSNGESYVKNETFKIYSENNDEAYRYAQANGFSWENIYALAGENASWSYNSTTKSLSVTGSGDLYGYYVKIAPWEGYAGEIWTISIGEGITSIGHSTFTKLKALNLELPSTLKKIGAGAFYDNRISQLICPENLEFIDEYAFEFCESLVDIKLNNKLLKIGNLAFYNIGAKLVKVPTDGVAIGPGAFGYYKNVYTGKQTLDPDFALCGETGSTAETYANENNITFYNSIGTTGDLEWIYSENNQHLMIIGSGETADYNSASEQPWYGKNITSIVFSGDVTHIGDYAFAGLNLSSIEFPAALTSIGKHAFDSAFGNRLTDISIPISVGKVDKDAFKGNTFNSVAVMKKTCDIDESKDTLGTASKIIGTTGSNAYNFAQQHGIQFVSASGGTVGNWSWEFDAESGLLTISGEGAMKNYKVGEDPPWYSFRNEIKAITIGSGITRIGNRAFVGCLRNENFLIEGKYNEETYSYEYALNSIGDSAFANNASLQMADETIIPPTLKEIAITRSEAARICISSICRTDLKLSARTPSRLCLCSKA